MWIAHWATQIFVTYFQGQKLLQKERNYGLALLKMFMAFEVVLCHCWNIACGNLPIYQKIFAGLEGIAVPVFMFLSFYFLERTFLNCTSENIKKRLFRVSYPQFGWAFIYFFVYGSLKFLFNKFQTLKISDLFLQILFGHTINTSMWFQFVLIVLTVIFFLVFYFWKEKNGILIIHILLLVSFLIQYTGLNSYAFSNLPSSLKYPLGRFFPMVPYAVIGFDFAYFSIFEKMKENRIYWLILFFLSTIFLLKFKIINEAPGDGFYSSNNAILTALCISGFAYLLPFEKINEKCLRLIEFISKYTLGIYCMHRLVNKFACQIFVHMGFEESSFLGCILVYIICFMISLLVSKIPSKFAKTLVE